MGVGFFCVARNHANVEFRRAKWKPDAFALRAEPFLLVTIPGSGPPPAGQFACSKRRGDRI
jgi:hypothetical protein